MRVSKLGDNNPSKRRLVRDKISNTLKGKPYIRHKIEKNKNFGKGEGESSKKYYAKIRDDYTCQICGLRDHDIMEVDHIIPRCDAPHLSADINNLITLCPNCHRRKSNRENKERNESNKIYTDIS